MMTPEHASIIAEFLLPQIEQEVATTTRVLAAVPEDKKDYCPSGNCMKASTLVEHIVGSDLWFLKSIAAGAFSEHEQQPEPQTIAQLVETYKTKAPEYMAQIRQLTPEQLATPVQFYMFNFPLVAYMQFMQKHSVHHRGQLSAYLRPMGAKVPNIYGGSYDEPMTADASA